MHAEPHLTLTSTYRPGRQVAGILRGHLAAALELLSATKPGAARIHAARQELKRARAMLRLLRGSIDPAQFRQQDATLRKAAQQLNDVRDAEVLYRLCSRLQKACKDGPRRPNLEPLRRLLLQERRSSASRASKESLETARALLAQATEHMRDWSVANDLDLLTSAMRRTYRRGRSRWRAARESGADEHFHAWRRQVKYSAHQLEALGSLAPARTKKRLRRCAKLAKLLGKDHDLSMLQARIADAPVDAASQLRLAAAIRHERGELQRRALQLGKRLYRTRIRETVRIANA